MREYDNVEYRYKSDDASREKGIRFVSGYLGLTPNIDSLEFDLSFFSGGIGIDDNLAFSCLLGSHQWEIVINKLQR